VIKNRVFILAKILQNGNQNNPETKEQNHFTMIIVMFAYNWYFCQYLIFLFHLRLKLDVLVKNSINFMLKKAKYILIKNVIKLRLKMDFLIKNVINLRQKEKF